MNKHGQTLILFVLLIPIIILLAAVLIDTGVVISKKTTLQEVTKEAIKEVLIDDKDKNVIEEVLVKNNIEVAKLEINFLEDKIEVKNEIDVDSVFGAIIGIEKYHIKSDIVGYKENDKIIFE